MKSYSLVVTAGLLLSCMQFLSSCRKERDQIKKGVLIRSESAAIWLPLLRIPSAKGESVTLDEVAKQLESQVFGSMQRGDSEQIVQVVCDKDISSREVSFDLPTDTTALELLTAVALTADCLILIDENLITLKAAVR